MLAVWQAEGVLWKKTGVEGLAGILPKWRSQGLSERSVEMPSRRRWRYSIACGVDKVISAMMQPPFA